MRDLDRILGDAADAGRHAATPLAPSQIRAVGARVRTVRTVVVTTLTAAVVAGVVIIVTTAGVPTASPEFVDSPTPTETTRSTTPPSTDPPSTPPTTSAEPTIDPPPILPGTMLTVEDLDEIGPGGGLGPWTWLELDGPVPRCVPGVSPAALESAAIRFGFEERQGYMTVQRAEAYATPAEAATRLAELRAEIGECAEQSADVNLFAAFTLSGVGDAGFIVETREPDEGLLDLPPGGSPDSSLYATSRFAQTGRVVTWTVWTVGKAEYLAYPEVAEIGTAIDRLCGPAGGACTGTAGLTITYPTEQAGSEVEPGAESHLI